MSFSVGAGRFRIFVVIGRLDGCNLTNGEAPFPVPSFYQVSDFVH